MWSRAGLRVVVAGGLVWVAGCTMGWAQVGEQGTVPEATATDVPSGQRMVLSVRGEGLQVYTCQMAAGEAGWVFEEPEAKLLNERGTVVGSHGAGPTWRMKDGSSVVGQVLAKEPGAGPKDIPSLLLRVTSHGGKGALGTVAYVRRTEAKGGMAPGEGCDAAHAGSEARVPYTATYSFYAAR